jgi:hypothetical protein
MAPMKSDASGKDLMLGGLIQCAEAATLGMPFEVRAKKYLSSEN